MTPQLKKVTLAVIVFAILTYLFNLFIVYNVQHTVAAYNKAHVGMLATGGPTPLAWSIIRALNIILFFDVLLVLSTIVIFFILKRTRQQKKYFSKSVKRIWWVIGSSLYLYLSYQLAFMIYYSQEIGVRLIDLI